MFRANFGRQITMKRMPLFCLCQPNATMFGKVKSEKKKEVNIIWPVVQRT